MIKLDSGKEIRVSNFSFGYTYSGLLCGLPNEKMNRSIFERITYPSNWGINRPILKIQPSTIEQEIELKPAYYSAWLDSKEPIHNSKFDGSHLVVIWLDDPPKGKTIDEIIVQGVKAINWEANAQDYEM